MPVRARFRSGLAPFYRGAGLARHVLILPTFRLDQVVSAVGAPREEIRRIEGKAVICRQVIDPHRLRSRVLGEGGDIWRLV
jgi:hypothetical protein